MKYSSVVLVLFLCFACQLSSEKEMRLNKDLRQFILVRNTGDGLSFLNYTHPLIVEYYKQKGNLALRKKFQQMPKNYNHSDRVDSLIYWDEPIIKAITSNDSLIEAKVEITLVKNGKNIDSTAIIYAITTQNAQGWLFADAQDYYTVFPTGLRLFKD